MKTLHVKKLVLLTILSSALVGCGTLNEYNNGVSGITIANFNPMTPLGNLYAPSNSGYWRNVRAGFKLDHYTNRPEVQEQIRWFQEHPQYFFRVLYHSAPYLYFVSEQVKKRSIPGEIALIPVIESSYNARGTNASSGAAGIWQLMPRTARGFGLKRSFWYDGRRDIFASTDAALDYFSYLHSFFNGDWLLAMAAYDTGEGNVRNHQYHNYRNGRGTDYWNLHLPQETEIYVPRLLALAAIIQNPNRYHMQLPNVKNGPYFASIELNRQISLEDIAKLSGMSVHDVKELNPEFSHGETTSSGIYHLLLPIDKVDVFKQNLANYHFSEKPSWFSRWTQRKKHHHEGNTASKLDNHEETVKHQVHRGENLWSIARKYGVSEKTIKRLNHLNHGHIKPGQVLIIRETYIHHGNKSFIGHSEVRAQREKQHAAKTSLHSSSYHVKAGDTLSHIAHKFGVSVRALKAHNGLKSEHLHIGQKLTIPAK